MIIVIVGPTGVGKTKLSVALAKKFNGEVINADSMQVYKGLDIATAKIKEEEKEEIVHHLFDICEVEDNFSVYDYQRLGRKKIEEITKRGKNVIIVGGTGLYIKAALYDYVFKEESTKDNEYLDLSNEEIYARLKEVDPKCLEKIHVNNRKRLVRALNVYEKNQKGMSEVIDAQEHKMLYDAKIIGLTCERELLYERIHKRIDMMVEAGLLNEIKTLLAKGASFDDKAMSAIGYKEFRPYFEDNASLDDVVNNIKRNTRHFAKRQYTWFNHQTPIEWFDINELDKALDAIKEWLNA